MKRKDGKRFLPDGSLSRKDMIARRILKRKLNKGYRRKLKVIYNAKNMRLDDFDEENFEEN